MENMNENHYLLHEKLSKNRKENYGMKINGRFKDDSVSKCFFAIYFDICRLKYLSFNFEFR